MWNCVRCLETVEESFEVCWNCGTTREGVADPTFQKADDAGDQRSIVEPDGDFEPGASLPEAVPPMRSDAPLAAARLDFEFAKQFKCARCEKRGGLTKRVPLSPSGESPAAQVGASEFLAVSCLHCGCTEFYNLQIIDGRISGKALEWMFQ